MLVIDASVALKWVLQEADSHLAEAVLENSSKLIAPQILDIEIYSVLSKKARFKEATDKIAQDSLGLWNEMKKNRVPVLIDADEELKRQAFDLSLESKHPYYDCLYVALAKHMNAVLVTADIKLQKRLGEYGADIRLLETIH